MTVLPSPAQTLPSLPFGAAYAADLHRPEDLRERLQALWGGALRCTVDPGWRARLCLLSLGGLRVASWQHGAFSFEAGAGESLRVVLPFAGRWHVQCGEQSLVAAAGEQALLLPAGAVRAQVTTGSALVLVVPAERLAAQARQMARAAGLAEPDVPDFTQPRLLSMRAAGLPLPAVLRQLCEMIDSVGGRPQLLALQGLDEMLLRHVVLMATPEQFVPEAPAAPAGGRRAIDRVCQYVMAHLHARITLSDLESAGAMSERALQYAFLSRHQCTPMQWVKRQRLQEARRRLLQAGERDSVAQIALACGFVNQGSFAAEYRRAYGERPSETLRAALADGAGPLPAPPRQQGAMRCP